MRACADPTAPEGHDTAAGGASAPAAANERRPGESLLFHCEPPGRVAPTKVWELLRLLPRMGDDLVSRPQPKCGSRLNQSVGGLLPCMASTCRVALNCMKGGEGNGHLDYVVVWQ